MDRKSQSTPVGAHSGTHSGNHSGAHDSPTLPVADAVAISGDSLNARRRRAVELRIAGTSLSDIQREVKLSNPTIINAHKAFLEGGWQAVDRKARGRTAGEVALGDDETILKSEIFSLPPENVDASQHLWSNRLLKQWLQQSHQKNVSLRTAAKYAQRWQLSAETASSPGGALKQQSVPAAQSIDAARRKGFAIFSIGSTRIDTHTLLFAHDARGSYSWLAVPDTAGLNDIVDFLDRLLAHSKKPFLAVVSGMDVSRQTTLTTWFSSNQCEYLQPGVQPREQTRQESPGKPETIQQAAPDTASAVEPRTTLTKEPRLMNDAARVLEPAPEPNDDSSGLNLVSNNSAPDQVANKASLSHLERLEAESINIFREVIAGADKPVMLYSIGKDSAVMLHLARKAFYPAPLPLPLLHVDTTWKFKAMYELRDEVAASNDCEMIVHTNQEGLSQGVNPITHGSALHTDIMKTEALRQALGKFGFDVAVAGARRDEEISRAKERVFSFRNDQHRWDPRNQRPELWQQYNTRKKQGESIRVFPLSNWTELDIWQYIQREDIPVVPLYFAAERPVVERDGNLVMLDDDRLPLNPGEVPTLRKVRFRTLGCYPLTSAIESNASTVPEIIAETFLARTSERAGRMIDHDGAASMEKKKQEGYF